MLAGVTAGAVTAVVAALVSLPLRSPDDILMNTATVVVATLAAGAASGALWRLLARRPGRVAKFAVLWAAGFGFVTLMSLAGETQLDHFVAFVLPLAAIVFPLTGVLTVALAGARVRRSRWLAAAGVVVALTVGAGLSAQGDEESGRLELPPRAGALPAETGSGTPVALVSGKTTRWRRELAP